MRMPSDLTTCISTNDSSALQSYNSLASPVNLVNSWKLARQARLLMCAAWWHLLAPETKQSRWQIKIPLKGMWNNHHLLYMYWPQKVTTAVTFIHFSSSVHNIGNNLLSCSICAAVIGMKSRSGPWYYPKSFGLLTMPGGMFKKAVHQVYQMVLFGELLKDPEDSKDLF